MSEEKMMEAKKWGVNADINLFNPRPNYTITFYNKCNNIIGALDFNGAQMEFTGDASESAKIFFDFVAESFSARFDAQPPLGWS